MTDSSIGYGTIPWWVWNGHMKYAEIERQLGLMKDAGMQGWTLWARFGLETEYLSHDFMQRLQFAVEKSAELGLDVWAFDEFAWPTCSARGMVPEVDPGYRMRVLSCFAVDAEGPEEIDYTPDWGQSGFYDPGQAKSAGAGESPTRDDTSERTPISPYMFPETIEAGNRRFFAPRLERALAVPVIDGRLQVDQATDITAACDDLSLHWTPPAGSWRILLLISRDFGCNIDVLNPESVRCFLDLTHERYKRYFGEHFGTTFKGFFSDETRMIRNTQHRFPEPTIPWSVNLFQRLDERGIEDLDACLAAVFADEDGPEIAPRRLAYWERVTDCYAEAFYQPLCAWAEENGLIYTGDCFSEDSATLSCMGDYFKMVRPYHIPGLDALCLPKDQAREHFKSPKFPGSVAHQNEGIGAGRCLSEGPGLLGWGTTMEEMKQVTDWMYVFGVNLLIPNAIHYTIAHDQLYETPSYFYQWTLWPFYPDWDRYTANLGRALTRGVHCAPVAYYYPTETLLSLYRPMEPGRAAMIFRDQLAEVYPVVSETATELLRRQIDFDYLDRGALARSTVRDGKLELVGESFSLLVMPAVRTIAPAAAEKVLEFVDGGGKVLWIKPLPEQYDDGQDATEFREWIEQTPASCTVLDGVPASIRDQVQDILVRGENPMSVAYADEVEASVARMIELPVRLTSKRRDQFAVQQRRDGDEDFLFLVYFGEEAASALLEIPGWAAAEQIDVSTGASSSIEGSGGRFNLSFAPHESKLLHRRDVSAPVRALMSTLTLGRSWSVSILDPNLVVAEPVTVATEWLHRRAWEAFLQYRLSFELSVEGALEAAWWEMDEVLTYSDWGRMKVLVNGREATVNPGSTGDPGLLAADLAPHLRDGKNRIELELEHTDYMNSRNLFTKRRAPAPVVRPRVFGRFLVNDGKLTPMPDAVDATTGQDLAEKGLGLYSGRAVYRASFSLEGNHLLRFIAFEDLAHHAVVRIDGTEVGKTLWRPWRINCEMQLAAGDHEIEIEVTNTQANQMFEEPRPFGLLGAVDLGFE